MAGTMQIDTSDITDLVNLTANDATEVDGNTDVVVSAFNVSMDTSTGHNHDGVNSKVVNAGITGYSLEDMMLVSMIALTSGGI